MLDAQRAHQVGCELGKWPSSHQQGLPAGLMSRHRQDPRGAGGADPCPWHRAAVLPLQTHSRDPALCQPLGLYILDMG